MQKSFSHERFSTQRGRGGRDSYCQGIIQDIEKGKTVNFVLSEDGILYAGNSTDNARTVIP
jgi:hypothetical protein